ncbi:MAG: hypothetical protein A2076_12030 [Geobacteraceae bacterium GWC2_53_11]|nr:MAG: hypothetical protein A2076_12030 [Geobacteraceae bacterium GWC2_53_11]
MNIKILLADDETSMREALRRLLELYETDVDYDGGDVTVACAGELKPDAVVIDIAMPGLNCIDVTHRTVGEYIHNQLNAETAMISILTPRERDVLKLVSEGRSNSQIAADLDISAKTVDTHRQNLMAKLEIRGIADLTKYAIREGITAL